MKIVIVGSGLAGVIAANFLKEKSYVNEIVIISSSNIPPIGVGESSVPLFTLNLPTMGINPVDFLKSSKGSIKQGVYYKDWTNTDYINPFSNLSPQSIINLGNKPTTTPIKDYFYPEYFTNLSSNNVITESNIFSYSYHFDTNLAINFLKTKALSSSKVSLIDATVTSVQKSSDNSITSLSLSNSNTESGDYYINATGLNSTSTGLFGETYTDLSNVLPNNKAIALSLDYTNKQSEFHPYTEAKAMDYGWKWTIPTWDRVGVGYVFSTDYITVEQAKTELAFDLGLTEISPAVISFLPKKNENTFNTNHCSLGLANNFLDPLDSPTLMFIMGTLFNLDNILTNNSTTTQANTITNSTIDEFTDYLLGQFKGCIKNNTTYWTDIKSQSTPSLDNITSNLPYNIVNRSPFSNIIAFAQASKNIQFSSSLYPPTSSPLPQHTYQTGNHYDYINSLHN